MDRNVLTDCKSCQYLFHHELKIKEEAVFHIIRLIKKMPKKEVAHIRFINGKDKYTIIWIEANIMRQTHGSRLIRVVKAIARNSGKPIEAEVVPTAVGFFEKNGFVPLKKDLRFEDLASLGLTLMGWEPKAI